MRYISCDSLTVIFLRCDLYADLPDNLIWLKFAVNLFSMIFFFVIAGIFSFTVRLNNRSSRSSFQHLLALIFVALILLIQGL